MMLAVALALAPAGCKKKADEEGKAAGPRELQGEVSAEAKDWAEKEQERIWSDGDVVRRLNKLCKPADKDLSFYRDLTVLTQHPHRLAGYGTARTVKVAGREVKVARGVILMLASAS